MEKTTERDELSSYKSSANSASFEATQVALNPPALQLKSVTSKAESEGPTEVEPSNSPYQFAIADPGPPPADGADDAYPYQLKMDVEATNIGTKNNPFQLAANDTGIPANSDTGGSNTGLPSQLKEGVERLSGYSLDDVNVHYNSDKPAQLNAHAYAQGTDIHLGAGQEEHLPHEAWHVVQQKQGRVQATTQRKGRGVNDDSRLEKEADVMGAKAMQLKAFSPSDNKTLGTSATSSAPLQMKLKDDDIDLDAGPLAEIKVAFLAYNVLEDDDNEGRIRLLDVLDRKIYAYFNANPSGKTSDVAHGPLLKKLLNRTKAEHSDIVEANVGDDTFLPIDISAMGDAEQAQILTLWNSIKNATGGIKIAGSDEFKQDTRAELAKLLNTDIGRKLLGYLNDNGAGAGAGAKTTTITEKLEDVDPELHDYEAKNDRDGGSSYALATSVIDDEHDNKATLGDLTPLAPGHGLADLTPMNMITSILNGDNGVKMGDKKLNFGVGDSSIVKVVPRDLEEDGEYTMGGTVNNEVITPSFVTLGHELGHAFKIKAGALAQGAFEGGKIHEHMEADMGERGLWTNPEEQLNIEGFENKIREESGIHKRKYHKPLETIKARRNLALVDTVRAQAQALDAFSTVTPEYIAADALRTASMDNIGDDTVRNTVRAAFQAIVAGHPSDSLTNVKKQKISALTNSLSAEADDIPEILAKVPEVQTLRAWIALNYDNLIADTTGAALQDFEYNQFRPARNAVRAALPALRRAYNKKMRMDKVKKFFHIG